MKQTFQIHDEYGRLFNEIVYKRELANRISHVNLEIPITVSFQSFSKIYYLDTMVGPGGLFEFKATDAIHPRHRAQTINYLLLADLEHAKIINTRAEQVEHEFVNCKLRRNQTLSPMLEFVDWASSTGLPSSFADVLSSIIRDWGSALEISIYEEAVVHFLNAGSVGGDFVAVYGSRGKLGQHPMRLLNPTTSFRITAFQKPDPNFAIHCRRLLNHTDLQTFLWANLTPHTVTITRIAK